MIINGGLECGEAEEKPQAVNRIIYYREFEKYFGLEAEEDTS